MISKWFKIELFIMLHDLFISLPTGFGKSVIFQGAHLCMDFLRAKNEDPDVARSVVIVVMPLKSLVADQLQKASNLHIEVADLSGGLTDTIQEGLHAGKYSLILASPETLLEDGREISLLLTDYLKVPQLQSCW